jgi:tRNA dimethylallyltransferase
MGTDFLALLGPTASGKTALSLAVAPRIEAEIVSMDSRQVYRGMDIGTAKVDAASRARVPHHGLDLIDPDQSYSAGRFARDARRWIREIRSRGRVPLLVGGTGFFLRALTEPIFREPPLERKRREALRAWTDRQPVERLERWVRRLDPARAALAAQGGRQRLGRTLEVALLTGRPISEWHRRAQPEGEPLTGLTVVLELPRDVMDRRIDERVDAMLGAGLTQEVEGLLQAGYRASDPGMTATGYRELVRHLEGEWTLDRAAQAIKQATRQYARRQLTWFRNQLGPGVVRLDGTAPTEELAGTVVRLWAAALEREKGRS